MKMMRGLSAVLVSVVAIGAMGCAADAEPEPDPAPKETTFSAPVTQGTDNPNQAPASSPPADPSGTSLGGANGTPVAQPQPRITPPKK
jgi:hypothetical protein